MDIQKIVNSSLRFLEIRIKQSSDKVVEAVNKQKSTDDVSKAINVQTVTLRDVFKKFGTSLDKLGNPKIDVKVPEIKLPAINIPKQNTELIENLLQAQLIEMQKDKMPDYRESFDAFGAAILENKPKDEVTINPAQMKGLMAALTNGGGMTTQGGNKSATDWKVEIVTIADADTEYEYTFPSNTVSWTLKLRGTTAITYYSHETGVLPVSGDNSNYLTLPANGTRSQDNVEWGGKNMFIESDSASQVLEIEVFTM